MEYGGGDRYIGKKGLRIVQAKVRDRGFGLRPGLCAGSVRDDSAVETAIVAFYK